MKFKLKYFQWQPVSTIILVVTIALFVWFLISGKNMSGFLAIIILYISRGIMWTGWDKEEIIKLNKEIEFLKSQLC